MAEINDLNVTDVSNTARWPEGMAPSAVNNAGRADEGLLARWHKDTNASVASTGSANAYVVAANQTISAYYDGLEIAFEPNFSNTDTATLNVDAVSADTIILPTGRALNGGEIVSGGLAKVIHNGTNWVLTSSLLAPPWCDVTRFGAVHDNSTDDAAAFTSAVAAAVAAGHLTVYVPSSEFQYVINSQIDLSTDRLVVVGDGYEASRIRLTAAAAEFYLSATNIHISGIGIDGDNTANYGIRTNPATDAQRGGHRLHNLEVEQCEVDNILINIRSDGTLLSGVKSAKPGTRDGTGLPSTIANCLTMLTEGHIAHSFFNGATGWNVVIGARRCYMSGGRCNSGYLGNIKVHEGPEVVGSARFTFLTIDQTYIENPGIASDGATAVNDEAQAIWADAATVRLAGCQKITVRQVLNGLHCTNGGELYFDGAIPMFGTATVGSGGSGTYVYSNDDVFDAKETVSVDVGVSTTTANLSLPGNWRNNDFMRIPGVGAAAADLDVRITAGEGTDTLTFTPAATTTQASVIPKHLPRAQYTVTETGTITTGTPTLTLSAAGDWAKHEAIIVAGAGPASADLTSSIKTISGDGLTLTLNDDAGTTVGPGAAIDKPAKGKGFVRFDEPLFRGLNVWDKNPEITALVRSRPRQERPSIIPNHITKGQRILDGNTINTDWTTGGLQTVNVTEATDATEVATGTASTKVTGTGGAGLNLLRMTVSPPEPDALNKQYIIVTALMKREQVGASHLANTRIRLRDTNSVLFLVDDQQCITEETDEGGAGNKGAWLWYQALAYVSDATQTFDIDCMLDSNGSRATDDIVYVDHVDLNVFNADNPALLFGP